MSAFYIPSIANSPKTYLMFPTTLSGRSYHSHFIQIELRIKMEQLLTRQVTEGKGNKSKQELLGLHQDKKLLHGKGNN